MDEGKEGQLSQVKPVVLFTTPVLHHPPDGGPTLRIENSIKALARICDLYLVSRVPLSELGGEEAVRFYEQYCRRLSFDPFATSPNRYIRFFKRVVNYAARKAVRHNLIDPESTKASARYLVQSADAAQADVIWLGYGNISYPLLKHIKQLSRYKVVVDTDSVWSRFVSRSLPFAQTPAERRAIEEMGQAKAEEERWGTQMAEVTTAVSEIDADYYRSLAQDVRSVHIFSNVIDFDVYQQLPPPPPDFHSPCIYLAGSFFGPKSPMEDAARWVIQKILPAVRREIPDIHFYIVGRGGDTILADVHDPHITITGKLPSVLPYLCHADVALVPLRFESGTRFKILEAGACGIPIVSTTLGAEGLAVTHGEDIWLADEAASFAAGIVGLVRDRAYAQRLAGNLRELVRANYSVERLAHEATLILGYLQSQAR